MATTAPVSVNLLGPFEVHRAGAPLRLGSRRTEALFAYLVHTRGQHPRGHLLEMFWNEDSSAKAAGNLRVLLTNLRQNVGDVVEITRNTVAFHPPAPGYVEVDVHAFADSSTGPLRMRPDELGAEETEALESALGMCRGDFLEGFDLRGGHRFEDWLSEERHRLRGQRAAVVTHLAEADLLAGATPRALTHARLLLELEPLAESTHALMIRTHLQAGDTDSAVRQFELLERMLRVEFGTAPSVTTRVLFGLPSSMRLAPTPGQPGRVVASRDPRRPTTRLPWSRFVGRGQEVETVLAAVRQAGNGTGRLLFVHGEAGSGKTTLVRRAVRLMVDQDPELVVVGGSAAEPTGADDVGMLVPNILAQLSGDTSGPWLDQPFPAPVAARLESLNELDAPAAELSRSATERAALAIRKLARNRPVVVVLDGLHAAAPATVNLVGELAKDVRHRRLLLLCTVEPEAVRMNSHSAGDSEWLLARARRLGGGPALDLDLDAPGRGREFIGDLLSGEPHLSANGFPRELLERTEGHPLIAVETLRHLVRDGQLVHDRSRAFALPETVRWPDVPGRVKLLVQERLSTVSDDLRALLEVAAVQGQEFDAAVVAEVCRLPLDAVVADLSRRLGRALRLVTAVDTGPASGPADAPHGPVTARYRFRHLVLRNYLVSRLDAAEHAHLLTAVRAATGGQTGRL